MKNSKINTTRQGILALTLAGLICNHSVLNAANVSMTASDGSGSSSFNAAGKWSPAGAPSAGNNYSTAGFLLRTPTTANPSPFAGESLSLDFSGAGVGGGRNAGMAIKSPIGSTITVGNLFLNRAAILQSQGSGTETVAGNITVLATSCLNAGQTNRVLAIRAAISSSSSAVTLGILADGNGAASQGGVVQLLGDNSAYQGNWYICAPSGDIFGGYCAALYVGNGGTSGNLGSGSVTNNYKLVFNRSDSLVVNNVISGSGTVTMAGAGQVTLSGANTYSGATIINSGTLSLSDGGSIASSPRISLANGSVLDVSGVANFALAPGQILEGSGTVTGVVASVTGATLSPGTTNGGTLTINGNTTLGDCSVLWNLNTAALTDGTNALNNLILVNGNLTLTPGITANLAFPGGGIPVPGTYTLCQCTGSLTGVEGDLTTALGNNNYSATFSLNTQSSPATVAVTIAPVQGTNSNPQSLVWTGQNGSDWDTTTPNWTNTAGLNTNFNNGDFALFDDTALNTYVNLRAAVPGWTTVDTAATYNFVASGGSISGPGGLTKTGTGTLVLGLNNDYAGSTLIQAGVVQIGNHDAVGSLGLGTVTNNGAIVIARSDAAGVLANSISGSGSVTMSGSGTALLSGDNSYSGGTTVNAGTLKLGGSTALGRVNGSTTVNSGATLDINGQPDGSLEAFSISGSGTGNGALVNNNSNAVNLSGPVVLTGDAAVGGSGNMTLNGQISGTFGLAKAGTGTATLTGDNVYTGDTTVGGGILVAQHNNALGTNGTVYLNRVSGVALLLGSNGLEISRPLVINGGGIIGFGALHCSATGSASYSGPITINGPTQAGGHFGSSGGTLYLNGAISSSTNVVVRAGTVVLNNNSNTFPSLIIGGTVKLGVANAICTSAVVSNGQATTGWLDLNGFDQELAGLLKGTSPATVINSGVGTPTITLNIALSNTYAGGISGNLALTKTGSGVLLLDGQAHADNYIGETTVSSGTLMLGANAGLDGSSNIVVAAGATFDASANTGGFVLAPAQTLNGNGTVLGNVTASGTIIPGAGIGMLSFGNNLQLQAEGITSMEVGADGACDQIVCGGTLTYSGTLQVANLAGRLTTNNTFKLFTAATYSGAFANVTPLPGDGLAWNTETLLVDGTLRIGTGTAQNPTNITAVVVGGNSLQLSWPMDHKGWSLQTQTNSIDMGLSSNWFTVPGSSAVNEVVIPIDPANGAVFFRLVYP